jgi:hypothetical protein
MMLQVKRRHHVKAFVIPSGGHPLQKRDIFITFLRSINRAPAWDLVWLGFLGGDLPPKNWTGLS